MTSAFAAVLKHLPIVQCICYRAPNTDFRVNLYWDNQYSDSDSVTTRMTPALGWAEM